MEASKKTPIEDGKDMVVLNNALKIFDIKEQTLVKLEKSTCLKITDTASETVVRKFRQTAKSLQVNLEKHRLKLNREYKEKTGTAAGILSARVTAVYDNLDKKVKEVEAVRDEKKEAKAKVEEERLAKIQVHLDELTTLISSGMKYGNTTDEISNVLAALNSYEISAVDFQERTEEAEILLEKGKEDVGSVYEKQVKLEADRSEVIRVKKEQEAEAKRLADGKAEFDAQQAKAAAEQKEKDDAAAKIAAQEAEKVRIANEKLKADRKALEREKAAIVERKRVEDEKKRIEVARVKAVDSVFKNLGTCPDHENLKVVFDTLKSKLTHADHWLLKNRFDEYQNLLKNEMNTVIKQAESLAYADNSVFDAAWDRAKEIDEDIKKEKLRKDKERAALIGPDKKMIVRIVNDVCKIIDEYELPEPCTMEAAVLVVDFVTGINNVIDELETAGKDLA